MRWLLKILLLVFFCNDLKSQNLSEALISESGDTYITSFSDSNDLKLWSTYTGALLKLYSGLQETPQKIFFSDEENLVIAVTTKEFVAWDYFSAKVKYRWNLSNRVKELMLRQYRTYDLKSKMDIDFKQGLIAFAPGELIIFDIRNGLEKFKLIDHRDQLSKVVFVTGEQKILGIENYSDYGDQYENNYVREYKLVAYDLTGNVAFKNVIDADRSSDISINKVNKSIVFTDLNSYRVYNYNFKLRTQKRISSRFGNSYSKIYSFGENSFYRTLGIRTIEYIAPSLNEALSVNFDIPVKNLSVSINKGYILAYDSTSIQVKTLLGHQITRKLGFSYYKKAEQKSLNTDNYLVKSNSSHGTYFGNKKGEIKWVKTNDRDSLNIDFHLDQVTALAAPEIENNVIYSGSYGFVAKYSFQDSSLINMYRGHTGYVQNIVLSRGENYFLSTTSSGDIFLWDVKEEKLLSKFKSPYPVVTLFFTGEGLNFKSIGESGDTLSWNTIGLLNDVENPPTELILNSGHTSRIKSIEFRKGGKEILTAEQDGILRIWDAQNLYTREIIFNEDGAGNASYTPDGRNILNYTNRSIYLLDANSGKVLRKDEKPSILSRYFISGIRSFPTSTGALIRSSNSLLMLTYGLNSGKYYFGHNVDHEYAPYGMSVHPKLNQFATYGSKKISIWNSSNLSLSSEIINENKSASNIYVERYIEYSSDGTFLAYAQDEEIVVRNMNKNSEVLSIKANSCSISESIIYCYSYNDYPKSGTDLFALNMDTGDELYRVNLANIANLSAIDYDVINNLIAVGTYDGSIHLINAENGLLLKNSGVSDLSSSKAAIDPNTGKMVIPFKGGLRFYDWQNGDFSNTLKIGSFQRTPDVRFSPKGNFTIISDLNKGLHNNNFGLIEELNADETTFSNDEKFMVSLYRDFDTKINTTIKVLNLTPLQTELTVSLESGINYFNPTFDYSDQKIFLAYSKEADKNRAAKDRFGQLRDRDQYLAVIDIKSRKVTEHYIDVDLISGLQKSNDGKYIFFESGYSEFSLLTFENYEFKVRKINVDHSIDKLSYYEFEKQIVLLDNDGRMTFIDPKTGEKKNVIKAHRGEIESLSFYKQYALSSGNDGGHNLWNMSNSERIATFVNLSDEDYLIIDKENNYLSTKGVSGELFFKTGEEVYPFEQYDLFFNRPDRVLRNLGSTNSKRILAYKRAYEKRLEKMGISEESLTKEFNAPDIEWVSTVPPTTRSKKVSLEFKVNDEKELLKRINIWINDVPVFSQKGIDVSHKDSKNWNGKIEVDLVTGNNKIQISSTNQRGVESKKLTTNTFAKYKQEHESTFYVLAIGVSDYKGDQNDLSYASKDAKDLAKLFSNSFKNVKVITLLDSLVTKANVLALKDSLINSNVNDKVMLFIAGHGLIDEKLDWYFATHHTDFSDPAKLGVSYYDLESILDGIPIRNKLFLLDACHSGEIDEDELKRYTNIENMQKQVVVSYKPGSRGVGSLNGSINKNIGLQNSFKLMQNLFNDLRRGSGATVISAASGVEFAIEYDEVKNGIFTYSLINGLKEKQADINSDGEILISELRSYVRKKVLEYTNGKQTPTFRQQNLANDFVIWD